ncbi:hypothetical protein B9Z19DRAFT_795270 [Tuber borchii]|uniref:Uncharacterized protein n=1 Tax=Tuber borchii TaxID=42251 RepID=A0A2T6ZW83_TUBBO|nr:hypothetical protein B9Z19DRAFT_795270 [Tuber borchii]
MLSSFLLSFLLGEAVIKLTVLWWGWVLVVGALRYCNGILLLQCRTAQYVASCCDTLHDFFFDFFNFLQECME